MHVPHVVVRSVTAQGRLGKAVVGADDLTQSSGSSWPLATGAPSGRSESSQKPRSQVCGDFALWYMWDRDTFCPGHTRDARAMESDTSL